MAFLLNNVTDIVWISEWSFNNCAIQWKVKLYQGPSTAVRIAFTFSACLLQCSVVVNGKQSLCF